MFFKKTAKKFVDEYHIEARLVEDDSDQKSDGFDFAGYRTLAGPKWSWTPDDIEKTVEKATKSVVTGIVTVVVAKQITSAITRAIGDFSWTYLSRKTRS